MGDVWLVVLVLRPDTFSGVSVVGGFHHLSIGVSVDVTRCMSEGGVDCSDCIKEVIKEFRDDELEHLDIAIKNDAQRAPAHALLSSIVGLGCRVAIEVCKRL